MVKKRRALALIIAAVAVGSLFGIVGTHACQSGSIVQRLLHIPGAIFGKAMNHSTAELEDAFIHADSGPRGGAIYSRVVPTLSRNRPEVVGFMFGFKYEGNGKASIDSPSHVFYIDARSAALSTKLEYGGEHRVMPAPTTDQKADTRMRELQDQLSPAFFSEEKQPPAELTASAREYLDLFPRAVGDVEVVYYKELAPDWFVWLEATTR